MQPGDDVFDAIRYTMRGLLEAQQESIEAELLKALPNEQSLMLVGPPIVCECGSHAAGLGAAHSFWCPAHHEVLKVAPE